MRVERKNAQERTENFKQKKNARNAKIIKIPQIS